MRTPLHGRPPWDPSIGPLHTYIHVSSALRLRYHSGPSPWTVLGTALATAPHAIHTPVDDRPTAARGASSIGPCTPVRYTRAARPRTPLYIHEYEYTAPASPHVGAPDCAPPSLGYWPVHTVSSAPLEAGSLLAFAGGTRSRAAGPSPAGCGAVRSAGVGACGLRPWATRATPRAWSRAPLSEQRGGERAASPPQRPRPPEPRAPPVRSLSQPVCTRTCRGTWLVRGRGVPCVVRALVLGALAPIRMVNRPSVDVAALGLMLLPRPTHSPPAAVITTVKPRN